MMISSQVEEKSSYGFCLQKEIHKVRRIGECSSVRKRRGYNQKGVRCTLCALQPARQQAIFLYFLCTIDKCLQ